MAVFFSPCKLGEKVENERIGWKQTVKSRGKDGPSKIFFLFGFFYPLSSFSSSSGVLHKKNPFLLKHTIRHLGDQMCDPLQAQHLISLIERYLTNLWIQSLWSFLQSPVQFSFFFLMKITCNKLGSGCRNDAFILAWRDGPYSLPLLHCPARCGWKGRTGLLPSCFSFGKKKPWIRVALSFRSCRRVGTVTLFQTWWLL